MLSSQAAELAALRRENATLKQQAEKLRSERSLEISTNLFMRKLQGKSYILPEDMVSKFNGLQVSVITLVAEITRKLQEDPSHRDHVSRAMNTAGEAQAFRVALTQNSALRELATQPYSNESDVWTVCIWQFLMANVFSHEGTRSFYSSTGQNAAYYIRNIEEIDNMMRPENENQYETWEAKYARRLWRKQAIDAVFRTGDRYGYDDVPFPKEDYPWLASTRQESVNKLVSQILQIFDVFLGNLPRRADMVQDVVARAVHLNECFLHQVQFAWTIELDTTGESSDAFYNNLDNMDMVAVNTDSGRRMNLNTTTTTGMRQEDIRSRLYYVCAIQPALKYQNYSGSDGLRISMAPFTTSVKSKMAVGWTLNRNNVKRPENPSMFYIMAQSLRLTPPSRSII